MYCTNCGKKVNDTYKFCKYCGNAIETEKKIEKNTNTVIIDKQENLSMKYFRFYSTWYLFLAIVFNIINIAGFGNIDEWNSYTYMALLLEFILYIAIPIKLVHEMPKKTKFIFKLLLAFLILDYICKVIFNSINYLYDNPNESILTYILLLIAFYAIWYIPNIIYFIKRKNIFIN